MRWHECTAPVRFHEVDAFGILWHGHYLKYFEIGRLSLSGRFNLSVERLKSMGVFAPVVDMGCRLRESARYGDELVIRTAVEPTEKASLTFRYVLLRASDGKVVAEGYTTHVLMKLEGTMLYLVPKELEAPVREMIAYGNG